MHNLWLLTSQYPHQLFSGAAIAPPSPFVRKLGWHVIRLELLVLQLVQQLSFGAYDTRDVMTCLSQPHGQPKPGHFSSGEKGRPANKDDLHSFAGTMWELRKRRSTS